MAIQRRFSREIKLTIALFLLGTATVAISACCPPIRAGQLAIVSAGRVRIGQGLRWAAPGTACLRCWR
jgi:hypothetical protein